MKQCLSFFKGNAVQEQQQQQRRETPKKRSSSKTRQSDVLNKIKDVVLGPGVTLGLIIFLPLFILAFNVACGRVIPFLLLAKTSQVNLMYVAYLAFESSDQKTVVYFYQ